MTIHIDGDNISYKLWAKLIYAFKQKYSSPTFIIYRCVIVAHEVSVATALGIEMRHIISPFKGAVDTAITYAVAQSTEPQYIISNDKGFRTLSLLTTNVNVLSCTLQDYSSKSYANYSSIADQVLSTIFGKSTKLLAANVGQKLNSKAHGYSSLKNLVNASNYYKLCNNYILRIKE